MSAHLRTAALLIAGFALASAGAAQENIRSLEITVQDVDNDSMLDSIAPGETVQIAQGQRVRLRMTANPARGNTRYPSTRFTANDTNRISVEATNEEVGTITLVGRRVNEAGGAVPIQYEILESWPMDDRLRRGRVYVQVADSSVADPAPQPVQGSRGVELYADDGFRGRRQFFAASDPDLRDDAVGNDTVSSLKVSQGCTVTLFEDIGYRGRSVRVQSDTPSMDRVGFRNDAVSSFRVECN